MFFRVKNTFFQYCRANYNKAYENERSVEVPLGAWFINRFKPENVIEVGAVMMHYGMESQRIIDLAEIDNRVENSNALEIDYTGQNVLSISTVEHMMKREYNNGSDEDSINFVKRVADQAQNYLITFGMGYNEFLDEWVESEAAKSIPNIVLARLNWNNEWVEDNRREHKFKFGHRDNLRPPEEEGIFNNANAIYILHSEGLFS